MAARRIYEMPVGVENEAYGTLDMRGSTAEDSQEYINVGDNGVAFNKGPAKMETDVDTLAYGAPKAGGEPAVTSISHAAAAAAAAAAVAATRRNQPSLHAFHAIATAIALIVAIVALALAVSAGHGASPVSDPAAAAAASGGSAAEGLATQSKIITSPPSTNVAGTPPEPTADPGPTPRATAGADIHAQFSAFNDSLRYVLRQQATLNSLVLDLQRQMSAGETLRPANQSLPTNGPNATDLQPGAGREQPLSEIVEAVRVGLLALEADHEQVENVTMDLQRDQQQLAARLQLLSNASGRLEDSVSRLAGSGGNFSAGGPFGDGNKEPAGGTYFGDGSDGDGHIRGTVELTSQEDGDMVVMQYSSLRVESGARLTTSHRCKGLLIMVNGDARIEGEITMTGRGAAVDPVAAGVPPDGLRLHYCTDVPQPGGPGNVSNFRGAGQKVQVVLGKQGSCRFSSQLTVAREGGPGLRPKRKTLPRGSSYYSCNDPDAKADLLAFQTTSAFVSAPGQPLTLRTGGGGRGDGNGGGSSYDPVVGGTGGAGSCFSGGAGGGACQGKRRSGSLKFDCGECANGKPHGGRGGSGSCSKQNSYNPKSYGGAGNPNGAHLPHYQNYNNELAEDTQETMGTGGLLILMVRGAVTFGPNARLVSDGSRGPGDTGDGHGGGSGGGVVALLHGGGVVSRSLARPFVSVSGFSPAKYYGKTYGYECDQASSGANGTVAVVQVHAAAYTLAEAEDAAAKPRQLLGHEGPVLAVDVDDTHVVSAGQDGTVRLWSLEDGGNGVELRGPAASVRAVSLSASYVVSGGDDKKILVWSREPESPRDPVRTLTGFGDSVVALEVSSTWLVAATSDHEVRVYRAGSWTMVHKHSILNPTSVSLEGDLAVCGSTDNKVHVLNLATGKVMPSLNGHEANVNVVVFHAGQVLSGSDDRTIRVWDPVDGEELTVIPGLDTTDASMVTSLAADDKDIVSVGKESRFAYLWDRRSNRVYDRLEHDEPVRAVAISETTIVIAGHIVTVFPRSNPL